MFASKRVFFKLAGMAAAMAIGATASLSAMAVDITGAGAAFPYAVYTKWAEAYKAATQNFDLKNQSAAAASIPYHPGAARYFAEKGVKLQ